MRTVAAAPRRPEKATGVLVLLALLASALQADEVRAEPLVVTATRSETAASAVPVAVEVITAGRLAANPAAAVDEILADDASFSLFRRSASPAANPTAQGVSLRGLGASGTSRSLVLLDGIPLNDPFGGWIPWSAVPRLALNRAELVHGGAAGAWGNAALGGVLQLFTTPATEAGGRAEIATGSFGLRSGEFTATGIGAAGSVRVSGGASSTDGFVATEPARRGPIDQALASDHTWLQASWRTAPTPAVTATTSVRWFDEHRANGTPLQRNASRLGQVALDLAASPAPDVDWNAGVYLQDQRFLSFFSAVNAARTAETPSNDQFDVPAVAAGAHLQANWRHDGATTTIGADGRTVRGESRENFLYAGGAFTRRRIAGGDQAVGGVFLTHARPLAPGWQATVALRADQWRNASGHRQESVLATGTRVRDDHDAPEAGGTFSPEAGLVWSSGGWRFRTAARQAFRLPTLNELYRPFRVGNVTTEANPALRRERLAGGEVGLERVGRAGRLALTAFTNDLRDAVANVTLARTPTAVSRQRQNLDRVRARGLELAADWRPAPGWTLQLRGLWSDTRVRTAAAQPGLVGRRVPQVPGYTVTAGAEWRPHPRIRTALRMRATGRQYEDDDNAQPLAPAATLEAEAGWRISAGAELLVSAENLAGARVETGVSPDGIFALGPPRQWRAGLRFEW